MVVRVEKRDQVVVPAKRSAANIVRRIPMIPSVRGAVPKGREVPVVVRVRRSANVIASRTHKMQNATAGKRSGASRIRRSVKNQKRTRISAGGWIAASFVNRIPRMSIAEAKTKIIAKSIQRIARVRQRGNTRDRPKVEESLPGVVARLQARQVPAVAKLKKNAARTVQNIKTIPPA